MYTKFNHNELSEEEQLKKCLSVICGTKLLCYDKNDMAKTLNRPSVASGNSIIRSGKSRNSRNKDALKQDYKLFEEKAAELTDSGICRDDGFYQLSDLIEDYMSVSASYWEYLPKLKNEHHELFSPNFDIDSKSDILADIISESLKNGTSSDIVVRFLRLNPMDISTYLCNYHTAIGLLILMNCLRPCGCHTLDNRFRDSEEKVKEAVSASVIMIRTLYSKDIRTQNKKYLDLVSNELRSRVCKKGFYRLSLIYWFRSAFDDYIIKVRPDSLEEYLRPDNERKYVFLNDKLLFRSPEEDLSRHFYMLERVEQNVASYKFRPEEYYFYKCNDEVHSGDHIIKNERFRLVFYRSGIVTVSSIRWLFNFITNEDDPLKYESQYYYKYDEVNGTLNFWAKEIGDCVQFPQTLKLTTASEKLRFVPDEMPKEWTKDNQYMEGDGIVVVAAMNQITNLGVFLGSTENDDVFFVKPNPQNHLDRLLPYLTIRDKVLLIRAKFPNGCIKRFLYIEKNGRYSFDISDADKMVEYGVRKVTR